jgi:hypothetical protein
MSLYQEVSMELRKRGFIRPKRRGEYVPRVQICGKTEKKSKVILLAAENDISVGELIDFFVRESSTTPSC